LDNSDIISSAYVLLNAKSFIGNNFNISCISDNTDIEYFACVFLVALYSEYKDFLLFVEPALSNTTIHYVGSICRNTAPNDIKYLSTEYFGFNIS